MRGKALKYIILLATISIAGVFLIQFVFIKSSYNISDTQFKESASVALKEVAWQIILEAGQSANYESIAPVEIIANDLYLVNVDEVIDKESLKTHLIEELKKHDIFYDFEFAIFNPTVKKMEEGTFIKQKGEESISMYEFPENKEYINYFALHFPDRSAYFNSSLSIWYLLTGLLILVIFFFGYTLSVIIRQRQLSEVQKNFINNLTHELKTPISSIALSASVINNQEILKSPDRLFKYAGIIEEQNARLSKNVEKVLNLASLEKSRIKLNLEKINIEPFFEEVIDIFKQSVSGQKAIINVKFEQKPRIIFADKFHFANLIANILENAVKYCETSSEIYITLQQRKRYISISFIDNGIGISREHRKKIFKKFYRVPTGNIHNVKGFGLGLDYVHKIVKAHKWKIKVDDNPKGGSIFTLTIPN
jgi:two-component system phosphate regulon sensor histidine kinase PhoR